MQRHNTALLTIGEGPIAKSTFEMLKTHTDLKGVVFSKHYQRASRISRVREYGSWYSLQTLISQVSNRVFALRLKESTLVKDNIDCIVWEDTDDEQSIASWLLQRDVSLVVVCGFQFILRDSFYGQFPLCVNLHPSLLPYYKGPEPIAWGIIEQQQSFGITLHRVEQGIDEGRIISQKSVSRPPLPLFILVELELARKTAEMIQSLLTMLDEDSVSYAQPQDAGFYLPAPTLENRKSRKMKLV